MFTYKRRILTTCPWYDSKIAVEVDHKLQYHMLHQVLGKQVTDAYILRLTKCSEIKDEYSVGGELLEIICIFLTGRH